jgi:hypothetical protein
MIDEYSDEILNPSWIDDGKLLIKDIAYFLRDTINDGAHLVIRFMKLITGMSIWGKNVSSMLEKYLAQLREILKMKK